MKERSKEELELSLEYAQKIWDESRSMLSSIMDAVYQAEDEVCSASKYWKASDSLNRVCIKARREYERGISNLSKIFQERKDALDKLKAKVNETKKDLNDITLTDMDERFELREEIKQGPQYRR